MISHIIIYIKKHERYFIQNWNVFKEGIGNLFVKRPRIEECSLLFLLQVQGLQRLQVLLDQRFFIISFILELSIRPKTILLL